MAVARSAVSATIASDSASSSVHVDASSIITVGASDTLLIFFQEVDTSTPGTVTVHWDNGGTAQLMTQIALITDSTSVPPMSLAIYGLVSPTPGAKKFDWQWSGSGASANSYHGAISFTGTATSSVAAATEGVQTSQAATGANATVTSSSSIPSGDMAVGVYNNKDGFSNNFTAGTNPGDGGIAINKNQGGTSNMAAEYYSGAGSTITASAGQSVSSDYVAAIVGIKAAGSAAAVTLGRTSPNLFLPNQGPLRGLKPTQAFPLSSAPVSASLTGVASTSAAGTPTVTGFSNLTLTGVQSASAAGTPTVTGFANLTLTGVASTSAAGTPTVTGFANVTINGVAATSAANIPTVTGFANVSLTGVSSASAAGIPTVTGFANVTLTGVASASQIGTISVTVGGAVNVNLTGVESASSAGTPTVTGFANVPLTGVAATGSAGTVSVVIPVSVSLTGVAATSAAGTPTVTGFANVTLSGIAATGTAADVTVSVPAGVSVSLLGVQSNIVVGTLSTNLDVVNTDGQTILTDRRGAGQYSRKRHEEHLEAKAAVKAAEAKARTLKKKAGSELRKAAELAEQVIEKVGLLGDIIPSIEPLTEALQDATEANPAQIAEQAREATRISLELLAQLEDENEAYVILMLGLQ